MSLQVLAGITAVVSWSTLIGKLGHSWIGRHCIEYRYLLDIDNNDNNVFRIFLNCVWYTATMYIYMYKSVIPNICILLGKFGWDKIVYYCNSRIEEQEVVKLSGQS